MLLFLVAVILSAVLIFTKLTGIGNKACDNGEQNGCNQYEYLISQGY